MPKRLKVSEAATLRGQFRRSKYGAIRTTVDGIAFDSKAEARRYSELKLCQQARTIYELKLQPKLSIEINGTKVCNVILDFSYQLAPVLRWAELPIYEDVKGRDNALSKLKRKLVEAQYGIKVKLIRYGRG